MKLEITDEQEFKNRKLLPIDVKTKWLNALRSGDYLKGKGKLNCDNKYCCLGVLAEIEKYPKSLSDIGLISYNNVSSHLTSDSNVYVVLRSLGDFHGFIIIIENDLRKFISLASINDSTETFNEVIEIIEKYF